jgi:hypothetical protein
VTKDHVQRDASAHRVATEIDLTVRTLSYDQVGDLVQSPAVVEVDSVTGQIRSDDLARA